MLAASPAWALSLPYPLFFVAPRALKRAPSLTRTLCADRVGEDGKKTLLIPGVYAITLPGYQRSRAAPAEEYEEDEGAEEEVAAAGAKRRGGGGRGGAMEDSEAEEAAEGEEEEEEEQEEEEEEDE